MLITIGLCVLAAAVGWVVASARKSAEAERARAERDLARAERERSDAAAAVAQRIAAESQQARAVAESRLAEAERLVSDRRQMEETLTAMAHNALKSAGEQLVSMNKTQVDGSLETKRVEIAALLDPRRMMVEQ